MGPQALSIFHIFFVDDTLLFGKATKDEARNFMLIIILYELASGQRINLDKSAVVFSKNTPYTVRSSIAEILNVPMVKSRDKYLGLP